MVASRSSGCAAKWRSCAANQLGRFDLGKVARHFALKLRPMEPLSAPKPVAGAGLSIIVAAQPRRHSCVGSYGESTHEH